MTSVTIQSLEEAIVSGIKAIGKTENLAMQRRMFPKTGGGYQQEWMRYIDLIEPSTWRYGNQENTPVITAADYFPENL